ncbi:MAG: hypothetical protein R3D03_04590 [Geminicoccaceae bacterium]
MGLGTVTYLSTGEFEHRDSLGSRSRSSIPARSTG